RLDARRPTTSPTAASWSSRTAVRRSIICVRFGVELQQLALADDRAGVGGVVAAGRSGRGVARSDNLSAATHELPLSGGRTVTRCYRALLDHYGLQSTRIFPRKAHENGVVEQAHRRTKSMLTQMLVLRGGRDFPSVDEYQRRVRGDRARAQCAARRKT